MITCDCGCTTVDFNEILHADKSVIEIETECCDCGIVGSCKFKLDDVFDVAWNESDSDYDEEDLPEDGDDDDSHEEE